VEFADAAQALLVRPDGAALARERALAFNWDATVNGFLDVHGLLRAPAVTT
jgi:hypothetical protein